VYENETRIQTADGEMTTFIAHPDGDGPFPVAILYMDGIGYREQIKQNARRFAADGYYVVAPDLFYRSGDQLTFDFSRMDEPGYRERLMEIVSTVTPDAALRDTRAVLEHAAQDPAASAGPNVCVGYCMGARLALRFAAALPDKVAAADGSRRAQPRASTSSRTAATCFPTRSPTGWPN
jgi:carboxymethylenebutenolidase